MLFEISKLFDEKKIMLFEICVKSTLIEQDLCLKYLIEQDLC